MEKSGTGEWSYQAFISYAHEDKKWARWLQGAIETYRVPRRLVGRTTTIGVVPRRLAPIFRDEDELPAVQSLSETLKDVIKRSRFLIVICSPAAARARWVNDEVAAFLAVHGKGSVISVVVEGDPQGDGGTSVFPPALLSRADEFGEGMDFLFADMRSRRSEGLLRVLAALMGIGLDELKRRELVRRRRRSFAIVAISTLPLALFVAAADADYPIPLGAPLRALIDRHELSILRPAGSTREINERAQGYRAEVLLTIASQQRPSGWLGADKKEEPMVADTWTQGQTIAGVLAGAHTEKEMNMGLRGLEVLFSDPHGSLIERQENKFGWKDGYTHYTICEIALWIGCAVAEAHKIPDAEPETKRKLLERWRYLEEVWKTYRPSAGRGGWNAFPRQSRATAHSVYTSALALQMLAGGCEAGLDFTGESIRNVAQATVDWLWEDNVAMRGGDFGWRLAVEEPDSGPSTALSIFVLAGMLRAERGCKVRLGSRLIASIADELSRAMVLPWNHEATVRYPLRFEDHDGTKWDRLDGENIVVALYPWLTQTLALWSRRLADEKAPREQVVDARRSVRNLMEHIQRHVFGPQTHYFILGEMLYVLPQLAMLE